MLTFNDLLKATTEQERINFIQQAIMERKRSSDYQIAEKAMLYYMGENPDIAAFEKYIYDLKGIAHKDYITANSKIRNGYYPLIIDEAVSHLLANGVGFKDDSTKDKLGVNFDDKIKDPAEVADPLRSACSSHSVPRTAVAFQVAMTTHHHQIFQNCKV